MESDALRAGGCRIFVGKTSRTRDQARTAGDEHVEVQLVTGSKHITHPVDGRSREDPVPRARPGLDAEEGGVPDSGGHVVRSGERGDEESDQRVSGYRGQHRGHQATDQRAGGDPERQRKQGVGDGNESAKVEDAGVEAVVARQHQRPAPP